MGNRSSAYLQWTVGLTRWRSRVADIRDTGLGHPKCAPAGSGVSVVHIEEERRR